MLTCPENFVRSRWRSLSKMGCRSQRHRRAGNHLASSFFKILPIAIYRGLKEANRSRCIYLICALQYDGHGEPCTQAMGKSTFRHQYTKMSKLFNPWGEILYQSDFKDNRVLQKMEGCTNLDCPIVLGTHLQFLSHTSSLIPHNYLN